MPRKRFDLFRGKKANVKIREMMILTAIEENGPLTMPELTEYFAFLNGATTKVVTIWLLYMRKRNRLLLDEKRYCKVTQCLRQTYFTSKKMLEASGGTTIRKPKIDPNRKNQYAFTEDGHPIVESYL